MYHPIRDDPEVKLGLWELRELDKLRRRLCQLEGRKPPDWMDRETLLSRIEAAQKSTSTK